MVIPSLRDEFVSRGIEPEKALSIVNIYKNHQRRIRETLSVHHVCAKQIGGSESPDNKTKMIHGRHMGLHAYAGNEPPHQQVRLILEDSQSALTEPFVERVNNLIGDFDRKHRIYKNGIWI